MVLGLVAVLSLASAQGVRAWQDINFGDDADMVLAKMEVLRAENRIGRQWADGDKTFAETLGYRVLGQFDLTLAGIALSAEFTYYEDGLYRIDFTGDHRSAAFWDSTVLSELATLREVLTQALGAPTAQYDVRMYDLQPYGSRWAYIWRSGGVSRYLGIHEGKYEYAPVLVIQLDEVALRIVEQADSERQKQVQDAAGGF